MPKSSVHYREPSLCRRLRPTNGSRTGSAEGAFSLRTRACAVEPNRTSGKVERERLRAEGSESNNAAPCTRRAQAGYTLMEVMVVVLIVGVLATLAVYGTRKYVLSAKTAEAVSMITQIKAAEEAYRDEMFVYLGASDFTNWHPVKDPEARVYSWDTDSPMRATFNALGVQPTGGVHYAYSVVVGNAGDSVPDNPGAQQYPKPSTDRPFYVVMAKADLDGDGVFTYAISHSDMSGIHVDTGF